MRVQKYGLFLGYANFSQTFFVFYYKMCNFAAEKKKVNSEK